ncbi:hypothetical protein [Streptomyces millisiae]|uniref:Integral membrane protein n=1 Tax=Streptomyces millisiae TaxID=3075542 RepID=A0ABU2M1G9_9ACTN|nr:hypothetical protein [Streptomyces sp. DSM 44918]MDT0323644.1 hypothetical protein [Streptomyces sp. DSM 44918]
MTATPRRVRVTSPQTRIALSRGHRPPRHLPPLPGPGAEDERELAAARELFTTQRRHAARTLGLLALLLFGLSGLLGALPVLGRFTVAGVPASWLLLMAASYPLLLLIAVRHVRGAERVERASGRGPG